MTNDSLTIEQISPETAQRIATAPMPTDATLRHRQNLVVQLWKLAVFNFRILEIVTKEKLRHH